MKIEKANKEMVNRLTGIILGFEEKNWMKMKTTSDLAEHIVSVGFCPTKKASDYQSGIRELLRIVNHYVDDEYNIIDSDGINAIRQKIYSLIGEK